MHNYERLLARRIHPYFAEMPLKAVTLSEIKAWRASLDPATGATNAAAYRLPRSIVAAPPPSIHAPDVVASFSERELAVFALLARGRSNAEIAGTLFPGDATVRTHVARVLAKLDLRDRIQAVVLAYESGYLQPGPNRD